MTKRQSVIMAYLAMLLLSLPIPLLHHYQTDKVIEDLRPILKLEDGTYLPTLLPVTLLLLRWLGELSWWVLTFVFTCFVLSFWHEKLNRSKMICSLAICQSAFNTFYALYSTYVLGTGV